MASTRLPGRLAVAMVLVAVGLGLGIGPAGAASDAPDLDAFAGCVSAHSTLDQVRRGGTPRLAQLKLLSATVGASQTKGAAKAAKRLRKATTPAAVEGALVKMTTWCTAHGVPPITVPTTAAPG